MWSFLDKHTALVCSRVNEILRKKAWDEIFIYCLKSPKFQPTKSIIYSNHVIKHAERKSLQAISAGNHRTTLDMFSPCLPCEAIKFLPELLWQTSHSKKGDVLQVQRSEPGYMSEVPVMTAESTTCYFQFQTSRYISFLHNLGGPYCNCAVKLRKVCDTTCRLRSQDLNF